MEIKNINQSKQPKRNNNIQIINKNSLNNNDNTMSSSNKLTSNNFYLKKNEISKDKSKEKIKEREIDKVKEKVQENENSKTIVDKSLDFSNTNISVTNIILDNKFLNKTGIKQKKQNYNSDVAIYQDFVIDGYKYSLSNNKKNVIERLGDCIEKKYNNIELFEKIEKSTKNNKNDEKSENEKNKKILPKEKVFNEYQKYQKILVGKGYPDASKNILVGENAIYGNLNKKMKHSYSTSHILDKKNSGDFPLLLSTPSSYIKKFSSYSEKERNEKNILALLKLKHFLNLYWKKRKEIIKEFFDKYNMKESFFYKDNHLDNFANYINDNVSNDNNLNDNNCNIETRLPMIDIILKGIKYKSYSNIKKKSKGKNTIKNLNSSTDELSEEKEYIDSLITKGKIAKYKSFLNRNYKTSVTNRLLKGLTKEEKLNYFSKKKYGRVEIRDKNNLVNNLEKQALYIKRLNPKFNKYFNKSSIKYYNNDDLKKLNDELNYVSYSIVKKFESESMKKTQEKILGTKKYKGLNDKIIDKLNQRLYYTIKEKYHLSHPEVIPTQKKKLLEYIIAQKIQERKNFEQKLLKDLK